MAIVVKQQLTISQRPYLHINSIVNTNSAYPRFRIFFSNYSEVPIELLDFRMSCKILNKKDLESHVKLIAKGNDQSVNFELIDNENFLPSIIPVSFELYYKSVFDTTKYKTVYSCDYDYPNQEFVFISSFVEEVVDLELTGE